MSICLIHFFSTGKERAKKADNTEKVKKPHANQEKVTGLLWRIRLRTGVHSKPCPRLSIRSEYKPLNHHTQT